MTNYTPTAQYIAYPVVLPDDGQDVNAELFNSRYRNIYDRIHYVKLGMDGVTGRFGALLSKLGLTVTSSSDNVPPTYSSNFVLSTSRTHHSALEVLDLQLRQHNTFISNINNNVGGNVIDNIAPQYDSNYFIADDDSHHIAIEKLDTGLNGVNATTASNTANIISLGTRVDNVVSKVGTGADDAAPFDFTKNYFISDGESLKDIVDKYDRLFMGTRRNAEYAFDEAIANKASIESAFIYGFDTFYDLNKRHTSSTVTIDNIEQVASGAGTVYYTIVFTYSGITDATQLMANWKSTGTIVVKFNLIGSYSDAAMTTVVNKNTYYPALTAGKNVVIKVEFSGAAELYNISFFAK